MTTEDRSTIRYMIWNRENGHVFINTSSKIEALSYVKSFGYLANHHDWQGIELLDLINTEVIASGQELIQLAKAYVS